jgi:hypothetical protein
MLAEREGMSLDSYIVYLLTRGAVSAGNEAGGLGETAARKRKPNCQRRLAKTA